ncbi:hypothetical protein B0H16DRAFT_1473981 [Mycena metata]|uniref:Uncharacterized protein n=1 Tax=Mycena metata TaxID=1033252 RepID=A0AAD7HI77_9AGAR|nr:hypothetical protein B0H16DRAFT_1473981 [Mycena metata]
MAKGKKTPAASKRARKYGKTRRWPEDPEQREKRLQRLAEYRRRPEAREKQRVLMAERRAAVKARRRQWDPPKKIKSVAPDTQTPVVNPPQERSPEPDPSITSAEHVAIHMLLELADATGPMSQGCAKQLGIEVPLINIVPQHTTASIECRSTRLCGGRSHASEFKFVPPFLTPSGPRRAHLLPPRRSSFHHGEKLPPNASPSKLQKKLYRDLGIVGPLNWVQQAQMHVATLALSGSSVDEADDLMVPVDNRGPSFLTMGSRRWERIWEWREGIEHEMVDGEGSGNEMDWDDDARRGFAEAALR